MQYHQNIIHVHRPYMSRTYVQPFPPQGPGSDHARMMCMESAISIAKLLRLYETRFALRRINVQAVGIVCSAALLLIFADVTCYHHDSVDQTKQHLSVCFRALDEFSSSWESAKRSRDFLVLLQGQWELQGRPARAREAKSRKRTRTSGLHNLEIEAQPYQLLYMRQQPAGSYGIGDASNMDVDLDLDWIDTGSLFTMPWDSFNRL